MILIFCFLLNIAVGADFFENIRPLVRQNKVDDVLINLKDESKLQGDDLALGIFLKARMFYLKGQLQEALRLFERAQADKNFRLNAFALNHIGLIYAANKDFQKAKSAFDLGLKYQPNRDLQNTIRFELADLAIEQNKYDLALQQLRGLERQWKRDVRYPELLFRELKVENLKHHNAKVCKIARKLYSEFPSHPLVTNWSIDLRESKLDDKPLGCLVASKDQSRRIHRLQYSGFSERARKEIDFLRAKEKTPSPQLDFMLAQYLVSEGLVDEALKLLLKRYDTQKNNFAFLVLLARAAARAGEYETAVGAYYKASKIAGSSKAGREALFQAAFLSYQFQDYDGSARKFDEFLKKYSRSGLKRDALWHLAWIRYLKGDYEGALRGFDLVQTQMPKSRKRSANKKPTQLLPDRIRYWKAMSLLRLERFSEAQVLFQNLVNDRGLSFYSQSAAYRLAEIQPKNEPQHLPNEQALTLPQPQVSQEIETDQAEESEETLSITKDDAIVPPSEPGDDSDQTEDAKPEPTLFRSMQLNAVFARAQDLIRLGLYDWARAELYEIETRTRNKSQLQSLIGLYEKIDSFNRSSTIADLAFVSERLRDGIDKGKTLWAQAYPEAFKNMVEASAKSYSIPTEYVWSIMRAESQYKFDVVSAVGAKGLMQLMPNTGFQLSKILNEKDFAEARLFDPEYNIRLGTKYLSRLGSKFENSLPLIAAAYNAGPHRVENWLKSFGTLDMDEFIEHIPFVETRDYAKKVVRNYGIYLRIYRGDSQGLKWLSKPINVKPPSKASSRESWEI